MPNLESATFPEMSSEEMAKFLRHRGSYTITYFNAKIKSLVEVKGSSIDAFLDLNGIENNAQAYREISEGLRIAGIYTTAVSGNNVSIQI